MTIARHPQAARVDRRRGTASSAESAIAVESGGLPEEPAGLTLRIDERMRSENSVCPDEERMLLICRPFIPNCVSDRSPLSYFFVNPDSHDIATICSVVENYSTVLVESSVAERLPDGADLHANLTIVDDVSEESAGEEASTRILFLACNDTHVHLFLRIAERFDDYLFAIPRLSDKDENAASHLQQRGIPYIEIGYSDRENEQIADFRPDIALCANDWTSEFKALKEILRGTGAPIVSLQEGPQDWQMTIKGKNANKYRNARILFSQGAVTLKYISPKYFAVTGNPKMDRIARAPLPQKPRVFINCNFTYGEWEDCREQWMGDVIGLCKELGLDYLISKHPRDRSTWDDPNLMESSAFSMHDQMKMCSIAISRFSNIPYEALALGRSSVYYNPHGETMRSFSEDRTPGLKKAFNREGLKEILAAHKADAAFDELSALESMCEHCGPMDGRSVDRIVDCLNASVAAKPRNHALVRRNDTLALDIIEDIVFSVVVCTHNRANVLPLVLDSLVERQRTSARFEVIVVDNASTDNTHQVVEPYTRRDNVRYIHEPELGLSAARNTGWRSAIGQYIVFLDDDGEATEDWLNGFLEVLDEHPNAAACGGRIYPKYAVPKPSWIHGIAERFYGHYDLGEEETACNWVPGGNAAWRRDVLEALGGFDSRFGRKGQAVLIGGEESQLIHDAIGRGYEFYYSPNALMYHHIPKERVTVRFLARRWFGQGFSDFRYVEVRNRIGRRTALREGVRSFRKCVLEMGRFAFRAVTFRKDRVLASLFDFMRHFGFAAAAARCAWNGPARSD